MKALNGFSTALILAICIFQTYADSILFSTRVGAVVDAPVTLPDGRGAGAISGMVAQLFLVDDENLTPLEPRTSFITDHPEIPESLAYVEAKQSSIFVTDHCAPVLVRFQVWESGKGETLDDARENGGYYGESEVWVRLELGAQLRGLPGFTLQHNPPENTTIPRGPVPTDYAPGKIVFASKIGTTVDAPVFLPDGRGAAYVPSMVAQLFLAQGNGLVPLGTAIPFRTNYETFPLAAAYIYSSTLDVPLPPGCSGIFKFRAWEQPRGVTYEQAKANGGWFGESEVRTLVGGGINPPSNPVGLPGFTLQRQNVLVANRTLTKSISLHLATETTHSFTLEKSEDLIFWQTVGTTQSSTSSDVAIPLDSGKQFFRAKIE